MGRSEVAPAVCHVRRDVFSGSPSGYDPFLIEWDRALPFLPEGNRHICIGYDEAAVPDVR
jgi:hypothetical protein